MFASPEVQECMKSVIGWKNYYNALEIPPLPIALNASDSGEFYQQYHPALRLDIIKATIPKDRVLSDYLEDKVKDGITQMINDVVSTRKYDEYAKKTLANDILLDKYGWANDTIINQSRFVGFEIKTKLEAGLKMVIKSVGIQFTLPQSTPVKIYLFHSSKIDPVTTFDFTSLKGVQWNWVDEVMEMHSEHKDYSGGVWVVGYYQDDIAGQAINYTDFNWKKGPCTTCNGSRGIDKWRNLKRFMDIVPVYVPNANFTKGEMYDLNDSIATYTTSWGMNLKLTAECDLSRFFCEHRLSMKRALALKVVYMILKDIEYSQQINYIEESLKSLIIRDLEGDSETNYVNIVDQYNNELAAVNFDHSKMSDHCLPCNGPKGPRYKVA